MDNEKLIEIVREYTYLYDLSDKRYSNNYKKQQAWEEIGRKLKRDGNECKKAWLLLRDAFRRAINKKKNTKSGQASVVEKKWKYEDEMSFLLPYMKERSTICPILTVPDYADDANEEYENAQTPEFGKELTTDTLKSPDDLQQTAAFNIPKRKRTKPKQSEETPSTILMKYIMESKKNAPTDDIDQFMAGIATTLRSFPAKDRAVAKSKIFNIVSNMEIEILSRPSTSHYSVSTQSEKTQITDTFQDFYPNCFSPDTEEQIFEEL